MSGATDATDDAAIAEHDGAEPGATEVDPHGE
jgi:hypothetical protein